jgi:DNA-binding response OmpR family regulator
MRKSETPAINRVGSAPQFRTERNNRARNRPRAASQPVVLQYGPEPEKQLASEQAKGLCTRQTPKANTPFGHVARKGRQNLEALSPEIATKGRGPQTVRASPEPNAAMFFDESLAPMTSVGVKEIHRLARFLPVIVLIPRAATLHQVTPLNDSLKKSTSEHSNTANLIGLVEKAVERFRSTGGVGTVTFGDVSIDFSAMEALRQGSPVVLTTQEFKTLKYLVQNARRVISRDELLNEVWGYENYPCTRTVDNHILRLRQKLETDPSRPAHFLTIHRAGYKFLP